MYEYVYTHNDTVGGRLLDSPVNTNMYTLTAMEYVDGSSTAQLI